MTIQAYIKEKLEEAIQFPPAKYKRFSSLAAAAEDLISDPIPNYLKMISAELKEYDCHDKAHSERVLGNIEELLREKGIRSLTFAEAVILRLCCYFHDTGMILPNIYTPLLVKLEEDPNADPETLLCEMMNDPEQGEHIAFARVKQHFFCPDEEADYRSFLLKQLKAYQAYRQSLEPRDAAPDQRIRTRHIYLRQTHGSRVQTYAQNLKRYFAGTGFGKTLATVVGTICASHCLDAPDLRNLETDKEFSSMSEELKYDTAFLAMLLRLGDILHFDSERASNIIFAGWQPMPKDSVLHWTSKADLSYFIVEHQKQTDAGEVTALRIVYEGTFDDSDSYYFLINHLNRVDVELEWYSRLLQERERSGRCERMHLGLPEKVERALDTDGFTADPELRFRLEQQNIIRLLMGTRLYRNKFMCLRELYQNALDACRCMREEYKTKDNDKKKPEIEFGLDRDEKHGTYLYCRDQGIGMTEDIIKRYLLCVGKSYYQSGDFRRDNVRWRNSVAPVSEFGVGLLSCYMIADRIEIITRYYNPNEDGPICVCLKGVEDYGYFRNVTDEELAALGDHGTIVKLYLKDDAKVKLLDYLPASIEDTVFELDNYKEFEHPSVTENAKYSLEQFNRSLYHQIQQFVHIPEENIPVYIRHKDGARVRREALRRADSAYGILKKYPTLRDDGFNMGRLTGLPDNEILGNDPRLETCEKNTSVYPCIAEDPVSRSTVFTRLHLPNTTPAKEEEKLYRMADLPLCKSDGMVYIDGIPVPHSDKYENEVVLARGIQYHFRGNIRPKLTVDRAAIRETPPEVPQMQTALRKDLLAVIAAEIRKHYLVDHTDALTEAGQRYLVNYLLDKFHDQIAMELIRILSEDVLHDFPCCGSSLYKWFNGEELLLCGSSLLYPGKLERRLLPVYLARAEQLLPEDDCCIRLIQGSSEETRISRDNLPRYVFRADRWPEVYAQYDAVSAYPGIVPEGTYAHMTSNKSGRCKDARNMLPCVGSIRDICTAALSGNPFGWIKYQIGLRRSGSSRYVLCVFVEPGFRPTVLPGRPTPSVPEEGLSILLFDDEYRTAYVAAPGKKSRAELAALIPEDARERNKNRSYYFTDDTPVF